MSDLPSSKRDKFNRPAKEDHHILKQDDFKTSIHNIADLPDYLERINQNILNIDKQISKKEMNTEKVKEFVKKNEVEKNKRESLTSLKDMVKQSVEGINHMFKAQQHQFKPHTPEPEPQPLPFQHHQYGSVQASYEHNKVASNNGNNNNKNIKASVMKSSEKEGIQAKKNSKTGAEMKEMNYVKKNFKIDIAKLNFNNNTNTNTNVNTKDNDKDKDKDNDKDKDKKRDTYKENKRNQASGNNSNNKDNINASNNNNRRINNNDSTPNKCIINQVVQQRKQSKSPAPKKNCFPFKPKKYKEVTNNDVSEEGGESNVSSRNINNEDDNKKEVTASSVKSSVVAQKNKPQVYTSPNNSLKKNKTDVLESSINNKKSSQPQPQPQTLPQTLPQAQPQPQPQPQQKITHTLPKQQAKSPNYYTKGIPKEASIQDALRLMLFFNEYIISRHDIIDYKKHYDTINKYSIMLSDLLHSNSINNKLIESNNDAQTEDIKEKDSIQATSAIVIQRKWRLYKFKKNIPQKSNITEIIKTMVVNNYIDKEGFGARKLIGMLNESLNSFVQMKSNNDII